MLENQELIEKYNQSVPRYTSYPTVPYWHDLDNRSGWEAQFRENFHRHNGQKGISLYIHLPFCESLCTYCACNKRITTHHEVEYPYIQALLKEWSLYVQWMDEPPLIRELHLGGGTPTFFSPERLRYLLESILSKAVIPSDHSFSIEGHPNNTTVEHLAVLYDLGFRRISYGIQDNDPVVQHAINRIQPLEQVRKVTEEARMMGFTSVNYDLVYGLPFQTLSGGTRTMLDILPLKPDRIAYYSYAHVPWKIKAQRLFDENDLPSPDVKTAIYQAGRQILTEAGYYDIGMDHFALPHDELYHSLLDGSLHRNFMGYTAHPSAFLLGLGVSSISDIGTAYAQNQKELENYYRSIHAGELAIHKGYFLSPEDQVYKQHILDIACRGRTTLPAILSEPLKQYSMPLLTEMAKDGLLSMEGREITVSRTGRQYIRMICQAFDMKWWMQKGIPDKKMFSSSI